MAEVDEAIFIMVPKEHGLSAADLCSLASTPPRTALSILLPDNKQNEGVIMRNEDRMDENKDSTRGKDANRDPITKTPGAHPVGAGLGAAGGAAAGAAVGAVGGPVGAAVGLVAGGIAGGLAGKGIAEKIDPTVEDAYWRENYSKRPYVEQGAAYEAYQPAYRTGYEGAGRYSGRTFDEVEDDLRRDYEKSKGNSSVTWDRAKNASRDAWHRVERALPGDADGDGR